MTGDEVEKLEKKIAELKDQLARHEAAGKDLRRDPTCRQLRKTLKRTQRRAALLRPLTLEQQRARTAKLLDMINKRLGEITQGAKKVQGNPYVHSLRKKIKSLNKKNKKLDRIAKKAAGGAEPAAPASPAPAPEKK